MLIFKTASFGLQKLRMWYILTLKILKQKNQKGNLNMLKWVKNDYDDMKS